MGIPFLRKAISIATKLNTWGTQQGSHIQAVRKLVDFLTDKTSFANVKLGESNPYSLSQDSD